MRKVAEYFGYAISRDGIKWNVSSPEGKSIYTIFFENGYNDEQCLEAMIECLNGYLEEQERDKRLFAMLLDPIELLEKVM